MDLAWLRGVFPPIATPFEPEGKLAPPVVPFLEHLRDCGIDGVVALGSNGEAISLSDQERLEWLRALRQALPSPLRLLAGTGAESTRQTIARTQAAAAAGAECALVITPSFFRRDLGRGDLQAHYAAVASESPIPILVYNVPQLTGVDLPAEWFLDLEPHPQIVGLKDSSGNLAKLARVRQGRPDLVLLPGVGGQLADAMRLGADGGIPALANQAPQACA
jgi:4-hydroxy-2-oxoglutarate aldolase